MANKILIFQKLAEDFSTNDFFAIKLIDNGDGTVTFRVLDQPDSNYPSLASAIPNTGSTLAGGGGGSGDVVGPALSTDNAVVRFDAVTGKLIQNSVITIGDTGIIAFPDGIRQTFNPDATTPGFNVGSQAGDPSTPINGDVWYDSTANLLRARINGATVSLGAGASAPLILTGSGAADFAVGPNGNTNPVLRVVDNTASQADGISITGLAAGSGVTLAALSSGSNAPINLTPKGTGVVQINGQISYTNAGQSGYLGGNSGRELSLNGGLIRFSFSSSLKWELANDVIVLAQARLLFAGTGGPTFAINGSNGAPSVGLSYNSIGKVEFNDGVNSAAYRDFICRQAYFDQTVTAGGTTGDRTINKAAGTVNIAAAGTSVTVTNNLVAANSTVFCTIRTNDSTAVIKNVVPAAGSFVITLNAAATAEVSIGFLVVNGPN